MTSRHVKYYIDSTGRRVTLEYAMVQGVNDSMSSAVQLYRLLAGLICLVNLIPLNQVKETGLGTSKNVMNFKNKLLSLGINATVRRRLGSDINASCGQLRRQAKEETV